MCPELEVGDWRGVALHLFSLVTMVTARSNPSAHPSLLPS